MKITLQDKLDAKAKLVTALENIDMLNEVNISLVKKTDIDAILVCDCDRNSDMVLESVNIDKDLYKTLAISPFKFIVIKK